MGFKVKDLIKKNLTYLVQNTTNLSHLLNICIEKEILTQNEAETIKEMSSGSYDRNTAFYQTIQKKVVDANDLYDIFHQSENTHLIRKLKITPNIRKEYNQLICFEVPRAEKNFVGRESELKTIHEEYEESLKTNRLALIAVTGLGGIGKSELAKKFAEEFVRKCNGHCIWINADKVNYRESIQRFAESIKIPLEAPNENEKQLRNLTFEISEYFYDKTCLFILDNIENFEDAIIDVTENYKNSHPLVRKPLIILTSRLTGFTKVLGLDVKSVPLECLSSDQAEQFVKTSLGIIDNSIEQINENVQKICKQLHNYPLALTQAASYIKMDNGTKDAIYNNISEYITLLEKDRRLALSYPIAGRKDLEKNSICKSLGITLDKLRKSTNDIMDCISFFHCEKIRVEMVANILSKPEEEINEAFTSLHKYTICTKPGKKNRQYYISIHPMVQEVHNCTMENKEGILEATVIAIFKRMGQNQQEFVEDMRHLKAIWDHVAKNRELKLKYISLPSKISKAYYTFAGYYRYGYEFSCKVAEDLAAFESPDDTIKTYYLKMLYWKGNFLQKIGDFDEALKVLKDVLNLQLDLPKQNDKKMLWTRYSIGVVKMRQAKLNEAMDIFSLVHSIIIAKSKSDEEDYKDLLMEVENEKASVLFNQCKYNESLELYNNTLSSKIRDLGKNHASTLNTNHCIGMLKFFQGKYEEALAIFEWVAEITKTEKLRRDRVQAQCWMSRCLRLLKEYEQALKLGNTVLKEKVKIFGENHINVLGTRQNIATIYFDEGKFDKALIRYDNILKVEEKVLDPKYPLLLLTKHSKAATLRALGRYDDALRLIKEVLVIRKELYEEDHVDVLASEHEKATIKSYLGQHDSALKLYKMVLEGRVKIIGESHPDTMHTQNEISRVNKLKTKYPLVNKQNALALLLTAILFLSVALWFEVV